jgi:hypothetical protein
MLMYGPLPSAPQGFSDVMASFVLRTLASLRRPLSASYAASRPTASTTRALSCPMGTTPGPACCTQSTTPPPPPARPIPLTLIDLPLSPAGRGPASFPAFFLYSH